MGKVRVFLVDDHALVREGLRAVIDAQRDMEVVGEAADGAALAARAGDAVADVAVVDVTMPDVGGVQATETCGERSPA